MRPTRLPLLLLAALIACQLPTDDHKSSGGPEIDFVVIFASYHRLAVGDELGLKAQAIRRDCDIDFCREEEVNASFTWRSSNSAIATVGPGGRVRAVGRGIATIYAKTRDIEASIAIEVGTEYIPLVAVGDGGACGLAQSGAVYCWGRIGLAQEGRNGMREPNAVLAHLRFTQVASGSRVGCGITDGQGTWCWSTGSTGLVAGNHDFQSVTVGSMDWLGGSHSCALDQEGLAWCWGYNRFGQLGANSGDTFRDPVPIQGNRSFSNLSAGASHTCGVSAGEVFCWGENRRGSLGTDDGPWRSEPMPVPGITGAVAVAAGQGYSCAIIEHGATVCWGGNTSGQMGTGTSDTLPHAPTPVSSVPPLVALDASAMTCGLTDGGQVYCWGGPYGSPAMPSLIPLATPSTSLGVGMQMRPGFFLDVGVEQACAINANGTGTCWTGNYLPEPLGPPVVFP